MRYVPRALAALVLGFAVALLAGCGSGGGLLSGQQASTLKQQLNALSAAQAHGDCQAVASSASALSQAAGSLRGVNPTLSRTLADGVQSASTLAQQGCQSATAASTATTTTSTPPTSSQPSTTAPPDTVPTNTQTTQSTSTTSSQPETTPTSPGTTDTNTGTGTGGAGLGGGGNGAGGGDTGGGSGGGAVGPGQGSSGGGGAGGPQGNQSG